MKVRDDKVRLIQCLPESSKGLNKDFLIVLGGWHDGLHCLTEADLLSIGTSSQAEMGFKRKPPTNLLDLIEG